MSRPIFDDTLDGLRLIAGRGGSPTARYVLERRLAHPLRLSRRGDVAAGQLVEALGLVEARRWLRTVLDELES